MPTPLVDQLRSDLDNLREPVCVAIGEPTATATIERIAIKDQQLAEHSAEAPVSVRQAVTHFAPLAIWFAVIGTGLALFTRVQAAVPPGTATATLVQVAGAIGMGAALIGQVTLITWVSRQWELRQLLEALRGRTTELGGCWIGRGSETALAFLLHPMAYETGGLCRPLGPVLIEGDRTTGQPIVIEGPPLRVRLVAGSVSRVEARRVRVMWGPLPLRRTAVVVRFAVAGGTEELTLQPRLSLGLWRGQLRQTLRLAESLATLCPSDVAPARPQRS